MHDSTPVLVGVGQFTEKGVALDRARTPMDIAAEAARVALIDSGVSDRLTAALDTLAVIRIFPDSYRRSRNVNTFGRAENPPRAVARRLGANPRNAIYSQVGGNMPQKLVNEMAERIASGELGAVLITGSEAQKTAIDAKRQGVQLNWQEEDEGSLEDRGIGQTLFSEHERAHGAGVPIQTYPLFENALRAKQGHSIEEHLLHMGNLFAPFSRIAASNPYAFYGIARSAQELATVTEENRFIGFPYPKWMNAMDAVNQGAAVVMTSVARARELGIDPGKWVFLHGCGEAIDTINVTDRQNFHSSPAIRFNSARALAMAGKSIEDVDFIDIYSCFPAAVQITADELKIDYDDPRGLTVTGGLPFFGGPGNNYSMHGIASMVGKLRAQPGAFGIVLANGGYLTKHATGVYSTTPLSGPWERENPESYQCEVDSVKGPAVTETPQGAASVETYTVVFKRGVADRGIIVGRLESSNRRFIANTLADPAVLERLHTVDCIGSEGVVSQEEGMSIFRFN